MSTANTPKPSSANPATSSAQGQEPVLPEVVIQVPAVTSYVNALVKQLISLGYDASATTTAKEDLPAQGSMFFQFTDLTPNAAEILSQVEEVAKKYCWTGTANLAQMNEASAAIVISYPQTIPANCPGAPN